MRRLILGAVLALGLAVGAVGPAFAQGPFTDGPNETEAIAFVCDKAGVAVVLLDPVVCRS